MKGYRTLIVNALSLLIIILGWDQLTQYVSPEVIAAGLAIANALLRLITSTPVGQGVAKVGLVALLAVSLTGCPGFFYQPASIGEAVKLIETTNGSGCTYVAGRATPYADVRFLTIATYGPKAPTYERCLELIPADLRSLPLGP